MKSFGWLALAIGLAGACSLANAPKDPVPATEGSGASTEGGDGSGADGGDDASGGTGAQGGSGAQGGAGASTGGAGGDATECGNNIVENGEECDDGNTMDGDACDAMCKVAAFEIAAGAIPPNLDLTLRSTPGVAIAENQMGDELFLVVWGQVDGLDSDNNPMMSIRMSTFDAKGNAVGQAGAILADPASVVWGPTITSNINAEVIVAWFEPNAVGGGNVKYATIAGANSSPQFGQVDGSAHRSGAGVPEVASGGPDGNFCILWQQVAVVGPTVSPDMASVWCVDKGGNPVNPAIQLGPQAQLEFEMHGNHALVGVSQGFVAMWQDPAGTVLGLPISQVGEPIGEEFPITQDLAPTSISDGLGSTTTGFVATVSDDRALFRVFTTPLMPPFQPPTTFADTTDDSSGLEILATQGGGLGIFMNGSNGVIVGSELRMRSYANGAPAGASSVLYSPPAGAGAFFPQAAANSAGDVLVTWAEPQIAMGDYEQSAKAMLIPKLAQ